LLNISSQAGSWRWVRIATNTVVPSPGGDYPAFLQPLDPPPAGVARQANPLSHVMHRQRRIALQHAQDGPINRIQLRNIVHMWDDITALLAKHQNYDEEIAGLIV
jgi:hypothetical protein